MPDLPSDSTDGTVDDSTMSPPTFSLTPEQTLAAGLTGLVPGDTFQVVLHGTVTDTTNGVSANIIDASDGQHTPAGGPDVTLPVDDGGTDQGAMPPKPAKPSPFPPKGKPKQKVLSMDEAGFGTPKIA